MSFWKTLEQKITTLHNDLEKLKKYKLELQGGLETLDLIAKETHPEEENIDSKD